MQKTAYDVRISDLSSDVCSSDLNLIAEGVPPERIEFVGNIMIDAFELQRPQIEALQMTRRFDVEPGHYGIVTLHRPSNVDDRTSLTRIVDVLASVSRSLPLVFAVPPRTRPRPRAFGLATPLQRPARIPLSAPLRS